MTYFEQYRDLAALLGGYFNQDWDFECATEEEVLSAYVRDEPAAVVEAALRELEKVMASYPEDRWKQIAMELGCCYWSPDFAAWLKGLAKWLREHRK